MLYGLRFCLNFAHCMKKTYGKCNDNNVKMIKFTLWKTISVLTTVCSLLLNVYLKAEFVLVPTFKSGDCHKC